MNNPRQQAPEWQHQPPAKRKQPSPALAEFVIVCLWILAGIYIISLTGGAQ